MAKLNVPRKKHCKQEQVSPTTKNYKAQRIRKDAYEFWERVVTCPLSTPPLDTCRSPVFRKSFLTKNKPYCRFTYILVVKFSYLLKKLEVGQHSLISQLNDMQHHLLQKMCFLRAECMHMQGAKAVHSDRMPCNVQMTVPSRMKKMALLSTVWFPSAKNSYYSKYFLLGGVLAKIAARC